jgi:hypothetical protein
MAADEFIVIMDAEAVNGRFNFPLTYTIKNGQIMLAPIVLINKPQKSSQNWLGYSVRALRKLANIEPVASLNISAFNKYFVPNPKIRRLQFLMLPEYHNHTVEMDIRTFLKHYYLIKLCKIE